MIKNFKAYLGLSASLAAMFVAAGTASAQVNDVEDEVIATGFRQSLNEALDVKRSANGVVDAIMAEDIADFPDLNLAESLQRIPGIAITRQAGEGRNLTVRGLDGSFTRVRINGMEAISTTGGSDAGGGSNRQRSFDFNTFSSDLFSALVVGKSQSAAVEEGSLGANVAMKTAQPLDFDSGVTGVVSVQGLYNDLIEEVSPRGSGVLSYKNDEGSFGALLGVSYSDRTIREEGFSTVRFDDQGQFNSAGGTPCGFAGGASAVPDCSALQDAYYARIPRYGRLDYQQERLGLVGSLQFQPTDQTKISVDGLYSEFKGLRDENFMEVFVRGNLDNIDVTSFDIDSRGVLQNFTGNIQPDSGNGIVPVRSERRVDILNTEFTQLTGTIEHEFTDRFRGDILAGTSKSEFDVPQQATIFFDAENAVNGYQLDFSQNQEIPNVSFGDLDVTDPGSFVFTSFRNRPQSVDNSFDTLKANVEYDFNENFVLSAGASYKKFQFETREARNSINVTDIDGVDDFIPVTGAIATTLTGFGDGLGLPAGVDTSWVIPDFDAAAASVNLYSFAADVRPQDTRSVQEESTGLYAQVDFNGQLGNLPIRGDVGARYVETEVTSVGFVGSDEATLTRKYDDFLPALNVVVEPTEKLLLRGGVARILSRPDLGALTPGGSVNQLDAPYEVSQGNPGLNPFRGTAFDVSGEYYFMDEGLISVALFYKDLDSFNTTGGTVEVPFSQTGIPVSSLDSDFPLYDVIVNQGLDPVVPVSTRVNGDNGAIKGVEVIYQQPFTFLPVEGFGFVGNYTHVSSDDIINFSPNSWNATLYYEDEKFSARFSAAGRDAYLTTRARADGREERGVASTFNLDFSSSYQFSDALEFSFEAINLTDEFEHQTFDQLGLPTLYHHTGRNFLVGARYKF